MTCRSPNQRRHELVVKNGQPLKELLAVWPTDKRHHPCISLPDGVQLSSHPPQLKVMRLQSEGSLSGSAQFLTDGQPASSTYRGNWSLSAASSASPALCLDSAAIVGPPGKVLLTISGGISGDELVQSGQMTVELTAGDLAGLAPGNWPSGICRRACSGRTGHGITSMPSSSDATAAACLYCCCP